MRLTLVAADVANGDTIQFRLQVNFAGLNSYPQIPTLTVSVPVTGSGTGTVRALVGAATGVRGVVGTTAGNSCCLARDRCR